MRRKRLKKGKSFFMNVSENLVKQPSKVLHNQVVKIVVPYSPPNQWVLKNQSPVMEESGKWDWTPGAKDELTHPPPGPEEPPYLGGKWDWTPGAKDEMTHPPSGPEEPPLPGREVGLDSWSQG